MVLKWAMAQKIMINASRSNDLAKLDDSNTPLTNRNSALQFISALGLDIGRKRIGIAGCDPTGLIAAGILTIERQSFTQDVEKIRLLVEERKVKTLVAGMPYSMDGSLGFQARQVQKFAHRLAQALKLPVEFVDERLTSYQAEQMLIKQNISPSRHKGLVDRKAASIILQQWLDSQK